MTGKGLEAWKEGKPEVGPARLPEDGRDTDSGAAWPAFHTRHFVPVVLEHLSALA